MRAKIWRKLRGGVWASGLPLFALIFVFAIALAASYSPSVIPPPPAAAQGAGAPLVGWGWSSNIGWISASCANSSAGCTTWGLRLDDADTSGRRFINGFAWNDKIGWIKFNPNGAGDLTPDTTYPTQANTVAQPAYLNVADGRVLGWARACNVFEANCTGPLKPDDERGGWDGWISLGRTDSTAGVGNAQTNYGVQAVRALGTGNTINIDFKYFAWGQTVIGWANLAPMANMGVSCPNCDGAPPTVTLVSNDYELETAGPVTLTWTTQNAQICRAVGGSDDWMTPLAKNQNGGNESVGVPETTTFIIECTNQAGRAVAQATVTVGGDNNLLTVILAGNGSGEVKSLLGNDINCRNFNPIVNLCAHGYTLSPIVTTSLNAVANTAGGSRFVRWQGDVAGSSCATNPTNVACTGLVMNQDRDVFAIFNQGSDPVLTIVKVGDGDGTVSSPIGPLTCGIGCDSVSVAMPRGIPVSISQSPAGGSTFGGWSGDCSGSGACSVTMSADRTVVVRFDSSTSVNTNLNVNINGDQSGSVTSNPAGISCSYNGTTVSGDCTNAYVLGTVVVLTATTPDFDGWIGCDSAVGNVCTQTIDNSAGENVTASFNGGSSGGDDELFIRMEGDGTGQVLQGSTVLCSKPTAATVNCTVDNGSATGDLTGNTGTINATGQFVSWSGCSAGSVGANCNYNISTVDQTVTATFDDGGTTCNPGVNCFCDLNPADPSCDDDDVCTPGVNCFCDLNPTAPACNDGSCDPNLGNDPDCSITPACFVETDLTIETDFSSVLTTIFEKSGDIKSNISKLVLRNNSALTPIDIEITASPLFAGVVNSDNSIPEHKACLYRDTESPPASHNECENMVTVNNFSSGARLPRRITLFVPSRGTGLSTGEASPYLSCNGAGLSDSNCPVEIRVVAEASDGTSCIPVDIKVDLFKLRYEDNTIGGQKSQIINN